MRIHLPVLICCLLITGLTAGALAETITPDNDTHVRSWMTGENSGDQALSVSHDPEWNSEAWTYVNFNTSSKPSSAETLTLNLLTHTNSDFQSGETIELFRTEPGSWDEMELTWGSTDRPDRQDADPDDGEGDIDPVSTWTHPGELPRDLWMEFTLDPVVWESRSDYGFILATTNTVGDSTSVGFHSREMTYQPHLDVTYTDDVAVPAPPAVVLVPLALGAAAFVRRRREDG